MPLTIDANNIDISNREQLKAIIDQIEGSQNKTRKAAAYLAYECQEGRQKIHIKNRLQALYPDTWQKFRVGNVRVVKKIIKKKAKAYKTTPVRKLDNDIQTEKLNEYYEDYSFSRAFKEADRIYNLHKYVALWLSYANPIEDADKGTYSLQALAPYEYDVIRNDKGVVKCFVMSYAGTEVTGGADGVAQDIAEDQRDAAADNKKYVFFTAKHKTTVIMSTKEKFSGFDKVEIKVNEIGRIPIAFLSQSSGADYPIDSELADTVLDWCLDFSDLKTSSASQGHGQLVISAPENVAMKQVHMGMHTAINLPQSKKENDKPTTAEYISASPDLIGQLNVLKFSLTQILDDEGITAKSAIEGGVEQVASGFDRLLKEADVQDIIEDNQELYADDLELDVYLVLKAYEDYFNTSIFNSEKINVYFEKPTVLITNKEIRDNIRADIELGLIKGYEKHQIINPNLDDAAAIKREEEISAEAEERALKMQALLGDDEESDDEDEDEDKDKDKDLLKKKEDNRG